MHTWELLLVADYQHGHVMNCFDMLLILNLILQTGSLVVNSLDLSSIILQDLYRYATHAAVLWI